MFVFLISYIPGQHAWARSSSGGLGGLSQVSGFLGGEYPWEGIAFSGTLGKGFNEAYFSIFASWEEMITAAREQQQQQQRSATFMSSLPFLLLPATRAASRARKDARG